LKDWSLAEQEVQIEKACPVFTKQRRAAVRAYLKKSAEWADIKCEPGSSEWFPNLETDPDGSKGMH
jgi:hypothetical protein